MVMVIKLKGWQVHADRFIAKDDLQILGSLKELENELEKEREGIREDNILVRSRLAVRLRKAKRLSADIGHRQGLAKGVEDASQMFGSYTLLWNNAEAAIVVAALESISDVLGRLPDEYLVAAQIRKAFQAARDKKILRLYIDPGAAETVGKVMDSLADMVGAEVCELVVDASLAPGSCLVETDYGIVDGSISRHLEAIKRGLETALFDSALSGGSRGICQSPDMA